MYINRPKFSRQMLLIITASIQVEPRFYVQLHVDEVDIWLEILFTSICSW